MDTIFLIKSKSRQNIGKKTHWNIVMFILYKISFGFKQRSVKFRNYCRALSMCWVWPPAGENWRVVSPHCHYNITIHYNTTLPLHQYLAHLQFKLHKLWQERLAGVLSLLPVSVMVDNDNRYLYQSYFEIGPIKKFVSQRCLECGPSVGLAWSPENRGLLRKHRFIMIQYYISQKFYNLQDSDRVYFVL